MNLEPVYMQFEFERCGSNYFKRIVWLNFRVLLLAVWDPTKDQNRRYFKHDPQQLYPVPDEIPPQLRCIFHIKNPYSAINSSMKIHGHKDRDVDEFIRKYNELIGVFVPFSHRFKDVCLWVKYEDLLVDVIGQLNAFASKFGLPPCDNLKDEKNIVANCDNSVSDDDWPIEDEAFNPSFYLNHHYIDQLGRSQS